jgi:transposase
MGAKLLKNLPVNFLRRCKMKIDKRTIFEIHRLNDLDWSERKIARHLRISRPSVNKYLINPDLSPAKRAPRSSKLDAHRDLIKQFVEADPQVKAPVVLQRLQDNGFDGKITIVRDYLQKLRGRQSKRQAFIRFESPPGRQMQIDWGHFGSLPYGETTRKLYAFAAIECYSRMAYVEFTHSQNQHSLHQGLLNAFAYWGGSTEQMVVDNMTTAVIERQGSLIRFTVKCGNPFIYPCNDHRLFVYKLIQIGQFLIQFTPDFFDLSGIAFLTGGLVEFADRAEGINHRV